MIDWSAYADVVTPSLAVSRALATLLGPVLLSGLGGWLVWWGFRGDRSRGRPRCPACWYDMRGHVRSARNVLVAPGQTSGGTVAGIACPECGCEAESPAEFYQDRRRWGRVRFGVVVAVLSWALWAAWGLADPSSHDWPLLAKVIAYVLAFAPLVVGAALVWWGLHSDARRRRDMPRCPRCSWHMQKQVYEPPERPAESARAEQQGTAELACAVCGHVVDDPFALFRPPRRWRGVIIGLVLILPYAGAMGYLLPVAIGWYRERPALWSLSANAHLRWTGEQARGVRQLFARAEAVGMGTPGTDRDMARVAKLRQLRVLTVRDGLVTDAGLAQIAGLTQLEELDLRGTQITDAGLVHLKQLPRLRRLRLDRTKVTDAGLMHLEQLPALKELDLSYTWVTPAGAKRLKTKVPALVCDGLVPRRN